MVTIESETCPLPSLHCSFCGKEQSAVKQLIVGPHTTCICNECVGICQDAIRDKTWLARLHAKWQAFRQRLSFSLVEKYEWQWVLLVLILILQLVTVARS